MKQYSNGQTHAMYLDYLNNFLTLGAFADYYQESNEDAFAIIERGRKLSESIN